MRPHLFAGMAAGHDERTHIIENTVLYLKRARFQGGAGNGEVAVLEGSGRETKAPYAAAGEVEVLDAPWEMLIRHGSTVSCGQIEISWGIYRACGCIIPLGAAEEAPP